jgi:hypothetical protein
MSEGPLQPAHNAVAEVFCNVESRHLVQVGITDFFGDLLRPSYAVVFAIDHELISVSRAFWQHRLVAAGSLGSQGTRLDSDQSGPTQVPRVWKEL